jgi:hypothetical protein
MMIRFGAWLLIIWMVTSCSASFGESGETISAELSLELPVLDQVTRVRNLVMVDETGEFWILNTGAPHLIKVDPSGKVISSFGLRGPGPNELGYPAAIVGAGEGWVDVLDSVRRSVRRFDLLGNEIRSSQVPQLQRSRVMLELEQNSYGDQYQVYFDRDRFMFLNFPAGLESTRGYWLARLDQVDRDSLQMTRVIDFSEWFQVHREELQDGLRLLPIPLWTVCPDGSVALYRPFADSVHRIHSDAPSIAIGRAPQRLRDAEVLAFMKGVLELEASAGNMALEDVETIVQEVYRRSRDQFGPKAPAYVSLRCDHRHRLWLQRFSTEDHFVGFANDWDVLGPTGDFLSSVTFPPRFRPKIFRDGEIWGVREDTLDVNQIVRLAYPSGL